MNIAICDDNETDIKYIGKIIKKEFAAHNINCELSLHTDAKSLLDVNQSQPFDVIFLDLDMPRLNGMDVASQLNKSNSAAEIIFVTNHDLNKLKRKTQSLKKGGKAIFSMMIMQKWNQLLLMAQ